MSGWYTDRVLMLDDGELYVACVGLTFPPFELFGMEVVKLRSTQYCPKKQQVAGT
jgi:hypothetical protein